MPRGVQNKKANFDASHELEELLLEDNPLKARQRRVQDINNLSSEMRQMEEQYVASSLASRTFDVYAPRDRQIHRLRFQENATAVILPSK